MAERTEPLPDCGEVGSDDNETNDDVMIGTDVARMPLAEPVERLRGFARGKLAANHPTPLSAHLERIVSLSTCRGRNMLGEAKMAKLVQTSEHP